MRAWVVLREYLDHSAYEVLRVYLSPERAQADLDLVAGDHGMTYRVFEVPLVMWGDVKWPFVIAENQK
jgi:hypothetical protein